MGMESDAEAELGAQGYTAAVVIVTQEIPGMCGRGGSAADFHL